MPGKPSWKNTWHRPGKHCSKGTWKAAPAWLQEQVEQRDPRHAVLGPVLGQRPRTSAPNKGADSFAEVPRLAVEEMGALCPSLERLEAHCRGKDQAQDIDYHLKHCRLCQVDRQVLLS